MFNLFCKYPQLIPAPFHIIAFLRRYMERGQCTLWGDRSLEAEWEKIE